MGQWERVEQEKLKDGSAEPRHANPPYGPHPAIKEDAEVGGASQATHEVANSLPAVCFWLRAVHPWLIASLLKKICWATEEPVVRIQLSWKCIYLPTFFQCSNQIVLPIALRARKGHILLPFILDLLPGPVAGFSLLVLQIVSSQGLDQKKDNREGDRQVVDRLTDRWMRDGKKIEEWLFEKRRDKRREKKERERRGTSTLTGKWLLLILVLTRFRNLMYKTCCCVKHNHQFCDRSCL